MAHQMLYTSMQRQAAMLGYIDAIFIFSLICLVMAPAAFLMQKPPRAAPDAEAGTKVGSLCQPR